MGDKVRHRLKELRLGLNMSRERFAEFLGEGWYLRKVERLENGKTRMNEKTAAEIAQKLQINYEDIWGTPKTELGDRLQEAYEAAPEHIQKTIKDILHLED